MHSSVSAQHASPCKSMKDDVSCASQLFDMQTVFLCKFSLDSFRHTEQEQGLSRPRCGKRKEEPKLKKQPKKPQTADLDKRFV